jgi:hypothetical protein
MRQTKNLQRQLTKQTDRQTDRQTNEVEKNKAKGMEKMSSPCCWITELQKHIIIESAGERERKRKT